MLTRLLIATLAATVLTSGALAFGKSGRFPYQGAVNLEPASSVEFDVVKRRGKPRKVKHMVVSQVLAGCAGGSVHALHVPLRGKATIRKKKFKLKMKDPDRRVKLKGRLAKHGREAYGRLHFKGTFDVAGIPTTCDTGPRGWTADRD